MGDCRGLLQCNKYNFLKIKYYKNEKYYVYYVCNYKF